MSMAVEAANHGWKLYRTTIQEVPKNKMLICHTLSTPAYVM